MKTFRVGQIVPSSNVTMETRIPALLRAEAFRRECGCDGLCLPRRDHVDGPRLSLHLVRTSAGSDLDYVLDTMAEDVIAVTAAGLDRPILLGHSIGARTAIRATRRQSV